MTYQIREASLEDFEQVKRLRYICLNGDNRFTYENNISRLGLLNAVCTFNESTVVGFITTLMPPRNLRSTDIWDRLRPYVGFVGVLPEFREKGICTSLLNTVCATIRQYFPEEKYLNLQCKEHLEDFYSKRGFLKVPMEEVREEIGIRARVPVFRFTLG